MNDRVFLDTNVLIYLYSEDEPEKQEKSKDIIVNYHCIISTQVLNELANVMLKKFSVNPNTILMIINEICENLEVNETSIETIKKALYIFEKYHYSYYDSLIISAALENECKMLFTEDMQHKQIIDDYLTILNVYKDS